MARPLQGIGQRVARVQVRDRLLEVGVRPLAVLQGPLPERPLRVGAAAEGEHDGQGDLALAEIVSHGLAERRFVGGIVEHVVRKLKGDAEVAPEGLERRLFRPRPVGHHGAESRRGGEEGRGLGRDHLEVGILGGRRVVGGEQLQDLSLGDHGGGRGEDVEHPKRPVLDHELEGPAEQEVPHEDAGLVAPYGVGGGVAAAQAAVVDHVVMQERRGVDELDAGREPHVAGAGVPAQAGAGEHDQRPEALSAGGDDVTGELGDQRHAAVHTREDDVVDLGEILAHEGLQPVQCLP